MRAKQRATFKQVSDKKTPLQEEKQPVRSAYFDPRMSQPTAQRTKKQFRFNEPGT